MVLSFLISDLFFSVTLYGMWHDRLWARMGCQHSLRGVNLLYNENINAINHLLNKLRSNLQLYRFNSSIRGTVERQFSVIWSGQVLLKKGMIKQYEWQMSPLYQLSPDANASPQVSSTLCNGGAKRQTEVSERFYCLAPFDTKMLSILFCPRFCVCG